MSGVLEHYIKRRNRNGYRLHLLLSRLLCLFVFSVILAAGSFGDDLAREPEGVAILLRGPLAVTGLDFLPPNAIEGQYGIYTCRGEKVAVYYVAEDLVTSDSWQRKRCDSYSLYLVPNPERDIYLYLDPAGWSVFISFFKNSSSTCDFIKIFISKLRYFMGMSGENFSFPAVLQL